MLVEETILLQFILTNFTVVHKCLSDMAKKS